MRVNTWICLAVALCSSAVYAGGVGLGATRMVYSSATSQAMMQVRNTHSDATFLIQSWMENEKGERTNDFVITPPLYVMKPASESAVKIMFNGKALPADRETLYWMTVKAIPQQTKSGSGNTLQFASANRIKVFYRPERLSESPGEAWKKLAGAYRAGKVTLSNPTPYYLTTINVKIDGIPVQPVMVPPKSSVMLAETFSHAGSMSYQTINDYGAWTPATRASLSQ
ncbi:fimbrial biogenesis chaperone [Enterobacter roggenkampii]|uniref:fimbrial biogenesis chaperone n=1 Tax=Enterobacter roggenkampii TaxID=1812935 RepID=UPI0015E995E3|nr:fimbria/pilus periplasmic chaperone [Enterobacter roggenkampii]MBA7913384.1 fimbria/pilus periplasmic chaperone [Enterobacter roggenkampii]MCK7054581.1 fimbria/pilus periplasmic chaperone [Enterobacter roggenkampii]QLU94993.1 fimbria/pilus periplasmic chaperone [Enterobacter roggenkampii]UPQ66941.1 fimbria/pilus periplasmic chaperone [Enterobacter roggenkampii]HDT2134966.1 fimbria/pilus periplasmic chaperone [Enterobacter roggenkampii]